MNTEMILWVLLIVVMLFVLATVIALRNSIVRGKNNVQRAWADVIAWQRKKTNVIPELEKGIRQYSEFESSTQEKLTKLRMLIAQLSKDEINADKLEKAELVTKEVITGLKATFESYADLKASELYLRWMKELSEVEDNVAAAISVFNASVQDFNNSIQEFPGNIVNGNLNHEKPVKPFHDSAAESGLEYKLA